jgi:hypothetical protein
MASNEHDVEILETLTSTLTDSIHGYEEAANVAKPSPLLFQDDTKAAVQEVERGESHLKDKFEECMKDAERSPDIKQLIATTYDRVRFDHAQWDRLKSAQSN